MHITQITSAVICGPDHVGKWYCSDSRDGDDGDLIHRYLQHDGTWGKTTAYFDTELELQSALAEGFQPDFTLSNIERMDRADLRDMMNWADEIEERLDFDSIP